MKENHSNHQTIPNQKTILTEPVIANHEIISTPETVPTKVETPVENSQGPISNPTPQPDPIQKSQPKSTPPKNKSKQKSTKRDPNREACWRSTIEKQLQSGLTVREFCKQEKLIETSFHYWKREITKRDRQQNGQPKKKPVSKQKKKPVSKPAFIPIPLEPVLPLQPQIEIAYASGTTVRITAGCDEKTLSTILEAMKSC